MILSKIAEYTRQRVEQSKSKTSIKELMTNINDEKANIKATIKSRNTQPYTFETALRKKEDIAFICEVKKASPSKGIISEDFPFLEIGMDYENAGADAISVLTEPEFFMGKDTYLTKISNAVNIPVLRKDFIIDEYQIYEGKVIGADAVLLICSLLDTNTLKRFLTICNELGISALVEAHNKEEIYSAIEAGSRIIGVNNRDLKTFEIDINNSIYLRGLVPKDIIFVAESGIKTKKDINALREAGVNAVLIGESLMRSNDKKHMLDTLRGLA